MTARDKPWAAGHGPVADESLCPDDTTAETGLWQEWRALSSAGRVEVAALGIAIVLLLWALALWAVYAPMGR